MQIAYSKLPPPEGLGVTTQDKDWEWGRSGELFWETLQSKDWEWGRSGEFFGRLPKVRTGSGVDLEDSYDKKYNFKQKLTFRFTVLVNLFNVIFFRGLGGGSHFGKSAPQGKFQRGIFSKNPKSFQTGNSRQGKT